MQNKASLPRVLIVALSNWFGAPRLPKAFRRAGFHVTSFGFPQILMQRTHSVDEALLVSESASTDELIGALLDAMERCNADIVIPTDATAIPLVHAAALEARRQGRAAKLLTAFEDSLGDERHFSIMRGRKQLAKLAQELNVRQPSHAAVFSERDARAFATQHGYPVVLKEEESVAGFGVSICRDEPELEAALLRSSQNKAAFAAGLLAQSFVEGRTAMRLVVAFRGRVLGGLSALKLETWPRSTGPSTCVEFVEHDEMARSAQTVVEALGYSGFASLDFMLDAAGRAHLIELNPRPTPIAHLGERFGSCLCRHLHAALTGTSCTAGEPRGLPSKVALFPQEWVRDQNSPHLVPGVFHDVPWDEPDLVEAYMTMGRAQMRYSAYQVGAVRNNELNERLAQLESSRRS